MITITGKNWSDIESQLPINKTIQFLRDDNEERARIYIFLKRDAKGNVLPGATIRFQSTTSSDYHDECFHGADEVSASILEILTKMEQTF